MPSLGTSAYRNRRLGRVRHSGPGHWRILGNTAGPLFKRSAFGIERWRWSPDGSYVLLNARTVQAAEFSWWLVSISARKAARIDLTSQMTALGAPGPLPAANFAPQAWLADGTILAKGFTSGGIAIWATKLNVHANRLEGKPTKLAFPVTEPRWLSISGHTILFSGGEQIVGLQVIPFDFRSARPLGPPRTIREVNTGGYGYLSLSRSGNMLAFESRQSSG